jgi:flagellar hook-basal body complex protein FliE
MSTVIPTQSLPDLAPVIPQQPAASPGETGGFEGLLQEVNGVLEKADQLAAGYAQGKVGLTDAVLASNQADIAFQFVLGVRNRALNAYQQIMNLQV